MALGFWSFFFFFLSKQKKEKEVKLATCAWMHPCPDASANTYTLWCHNKMSEDELVVNPDVFSSIRAGDLLFLREPQLLLPNV